MGVLSDLAVEEVPGIFAELLEAGIAEQVNILKGARTASAWGDESVSDATDTAEPIPAIREPHTNGNPRYQNGGEWTTDKFTMPKRWARAAIDVKANDKLQTIESDTAPEKIFTVREVRDLSVLYEVITTADSNEV